MIFLEATSAALKHKTGIGHLASLLLLLLIATGSLELHAAHAVRPIHGEPPAPQTFPHAEMLVSTQKLAAWHLPAPLIKTPKKPTKRPDKTSKEDIKGDKVKNGKKDTKEVEEENPSFVLIDARRVEEHLGGHLPGAVNIESDKLQFPKKPPLFLPSREMVTAIAEKVGITADDRIVIYDAQGGRLAARIWFVLWAYGHEHVSILEGGFFKWSIEDRLITRKPSTRAHKGTWKPLQTPRGICTLNQLKSFHPPTPARGKIPLSSIIDARTFEEYKGDDIRAKIGGHIPSAINMPWETFMRPISVEQKGKIKGYFNWKEPAVIHATLRGSGIISTQPIVVYGQSGGRAAHLMFTLHLMGHTQTVNYYGGWREYGNRDYTPVER